MRDVIVTVPAYVPCAKPVGSAVTVTPPGPVVPLAGEALSQVPPAGEVTAEVVVKFNGEPRLVTDKVED